jgi:two-component system, LytTR family, response regulator
MLRCLAIDDEPLALELLEDNISKVPYLELVGKCNDAFEAKRVLETSRADLIFIDIQMPGMTGLQFIESLVEKPMVILLTAYKQYALEGYSLNVVDYLLKPVEFKRFEAACNKARELHELRKTRQRESGEPVKDFMFIQADYSRIKLLFTDIIYIEGLKDYLKIHLKNNKAVITRMTFKEMEEQLPSTRFIRIHKSYIVSVAGVTSVRKNSILVQDAELPVGETYKENVARLVGRAL